MHETFVQGPRGVEEARGGGSVEAVGGGDQESCRSEQVMFCFC